MSFKKQPIKKTEPPSIRAPVHCGFSAALLFAFWLCLVCGPVAAQAVIPSAAVPPAKDAAKPDAAAQAVPPPIAAIPIADVAVQAENALLAIRQLETEDANAATNESTEEDLQAMARTVTIRSVEMRRLLAQNNASIDAIRDMESGWKDLDERAASFTTEMTTMAIELDKALSTIEKLEERWDATRKAAAAEGAPGVVLDRIDDVLDAAGKAKKRMLKRRTEILSMQGTAANLSSRTSQARLTLRAAGERAAARLMHRDSPPVWSRAFWAGWIGEVAKDDTADMPTHASILGSYAEYQRPTFIAHIAIFAGMLLLLLFVRGKMRLQREEDASLKEATAMLDMPAVSAMILALLASTWLYPRAPRIIWMIIGMVGVVPVVLLARRLMTAYFYSLLYVLAGFYLADRIRGFLAILPVLSRVWLFFELLLFLGALIWMMRRLKAGRSERIARLPGERTIRIAGVLFGLLSCAALAATLNGQVRLAGLIAGSVIVSSYTAVVFYVMVRVSEGIFQALLFVPPLSLLDMVKRKKEVLLHHATRLFRWAAYAAWLAIFFQSLGVLQALLDAAGALWDKQIPIGTFVPTTGDLVVFVLIIWATVLLSRMTRFVLEEEAYPKLQLERGLPYAISTVVHYLILLTGFVLALTALKVDMTKFTILAGALSVGIGFGLQNIVNNFVSGLIVLFERPVKVGDTIQMGDMIGRVKQIGIRASVIASTTGAEVIIPNGKLISEQVINWTLSSKLRQVMVTIVTKITYDADEITELLLDTARKHPLVVDKPVPEALFVRRSIDQAEYELHVWTAELDGWMGLKSELMSEINRQLKMKETEHQDSNTSG